MVMRRYKVPPVGTQLPPAENPYEAPGTNPVDVLCFAQSQAQQNALDKNAVLEEEYKAKFANWFVYAYDTGRAVGPTGTVGDPHAVPPQPPPGFMAVLVQAEISLTWECQQVGPPVCQIPPYKRRTA